ncbi:MAG: hypothetical protein JJE25_03425 [Bacteroidia bacterium]|nr:hypothetical protein [Bacteroidia bacterium]
MNYENHCGFSKRKQSSSGNVSVREKRCNIFIILFVLEGEKLSLLVAFHTARCSTSMRHIAFSSPSKGGSFTLFSIVRKFGKVIFTSCSSSFFSYGYLTQNRKYYYRIFDMELVTGNIADEK